MLLCVCLKTGLTYQMGVFRTDSKYTSEKWIIALYYKNNNLFSTNFKVARNSLFIKSVIFCFKRRGCYIFMPLKKTDVG
jgi:hypothetical protein